MKLSFLVSLSYHLNACFLAVNVSLFEKFLVFKEFLELSISDH